MGRFLKNAKKCRKKGNAIIAEIKAVSPTLGDLLNGRSISELVDAYEGGRACAISYITSPSFGGSLKSLQEICSITGLPVLRKDFVRNRKEVEVTAKAGADAILLIAKILKEETMDFVDLAKECGLDALVEIHSHQELRYIDSLELGGINNRDILSPENVDLGISLRLSPLMREKCEFIVGMSGIRSVEDLKAILSYCDAALIGTHFMLAPNPEKEVRRFVEV
jgi:indole-3-glycerol phosphate synthase